MTMVTVTAEVVEVMAAEVMAGVVAATVEAVVEVTEGVMMMGMVTTMDTGE